MHVGAAKTVYLCVSTQTGCPNPPPTDVMVSDVQPHSVRVTWSGHQPSQTSYTVTHNQLGGESQIGFCIKEPIHGSATTSNSDVVLGGERLRAFTTYSVTVVAFSDSLGWSCPSQEVVHTTTQTGFMAVIFL